LELNRFFIKENHKEYRKMKRRRKEEKISQTGQRGKEESFVTWTVSGSCYIFSYMPV
jgi:hypothetical protein